MNDYGQETIVELANGSTVRTDTYENNPSGSSYVRICDPDGAEIAYWVVDEWAREPEFVMGAIMGAMNSPVPMWAPGSWQPHLIQ